MKQWKVLGYLGLLPFIVCLYLSSESTFWGISAKQAFIAYSAIILSFIAGTIWRTDKENFHGKQPIISNIFSLVAFVSLLIDDKIALINLTIGFILLFSYEKYLSKQQKTSTDYIDMRFRLTTIVVVLHIAAYLLWFF